MRRKIAAKAKAAGAKAKERRAGGAEPPVRTPEQVAAAEQRFNAQKQGALEEARHQQLNQRRPALAGGRSHPAEVARPSEAPRSNSTAAIGQPSSMMSKNGKPSASTGGLAQHHVLPEPNATPFAQRLSSEEVPKDPVLRRQMLVEETAQTRANARVLRGLKGGKPTGGCIGVARTDIKGLKNKVFEGGSRYAGDQPDTTFIHGDGSIDRAQSHAEQNLAGEFDHTVKEEMASGRLNPAELQGKNVYMHTELPTCNSCKWGKNTPNAPDAKLGVPMKLSKQYPDVTFTYTSDEAPNEVLVIKNGVATSL